MTSDSTAIATRPTNGAIARGLTDEQVALVTRTVAKDATRDELALFLYQANRVGLDPLAKQIYFIKRKGKGTIQTGIDGYRLIADRTGAYAGNDDPIFETDDDGKPTKATVTVWKIVQGHRCSFTASARWSEYAATGDEGFMWRKMPFVMLGKVCEAAALRKAFPAELTGIYTDTEMAQAGPGDDAWDNAPEYKPPAPPVTLPARASDAATPAQVAAIYGIGRSERAMSEDDIDSHSYELYGTPPADLTKRQASELIAALKAAPQVEQSAHKATDKPDPWDAEPTPAEHAAIRAATPAPVERPTAKMWDRWAALWQEAQALHLDVASLSKEKATKDQLTAAGTALAARIAEAKAIIAAEQAEAGARQ